MATVKYVSLRQLQTQLAHYLRAVEAGDSLTVTVRNRPVAKVIPIGARGKDAEEALNSRKPRPRKRALKVRNVRIAEAVLEDRGAIIAPSARYPGFHR